MKRLFAALFFLGTLASIALGQGYIAQHSIPIGEGPGVQGWGTGGPCASGQALIWQSGPTSDPSCATAGSGSTSPTTGSGAIVLQSSPYIATPTIASPTIVSAFTATGLVTVADLTSATITVNGITCTLGGTCSITAASGSITVGTTSVTNATSGDILTDTGGFLGQIGITGSGGVAVLQTSPYVNGGTIASPTIVSAFTATGLVTVADLTSSSITIDGTTCTLGSTCTVSQSAITSITVGSTAVNNATSGDILFSSGGTLAQVATTGSGFVVLQNSPYIVGGTHANEIAVSSFTATGLVTVADLTSPYTSVNNVTCNLGTNCTVPTNVSSPTTGSGLVVEQSSAYIATPTIASPTIVSAFTAIGLVSNADLVNASTTVNGQTCTLGLTCTISPVDITSLTVGSTAVNNATSGDILISTGGTLSQYAVTGSPAVVVLQSSPFINGGTIASPTIVSAFTALGLVSNADLTNASTTVNGVVCTLGSTCSISASAALQIGVTTITSGTSGDVLFNSGGTLQQYGFTGVNQIGTPTASVVLATSPSITSPSFVGSFFVSTYSMSWPQSTATVAALNIQNQLLTGGSTVSPAALTIGNYTVDCGTSPLQYIFNTGNFAITPPVSDSSCIIQVINASGSTSAVGTATVSGFSPASPGGTAYSSAVTSAASVTVTAATPAVITWTSNALVLNSPVYFTAVGSMPTGITTGTVYYVAKIVSSAAFEISLAPGGATINTTTVGKSVTVDEPSVFDLSVIRINGQTLGTWSQVQ